MRLYGTSAHERFKGIRDIKVPDIPDCMMRVALSLIAVFYFFFWHCPEGLY